MTVTPSVTAGSSCILYVSGASTATSGTEAMTVVTANTVFQITAATKRVLDPTAAITTTGTGVYTVNRLTGTFTFADAQTPPITMSGFYLPMAEVLHAKDFTLNIKPKVVDTTAICGTAPYTSKAPTVRDLTGTIGGFMTGEGAAVFDPVIPTYYLTHLATDAVFALKFKMSAHYELLAWVHVDTDAVKAAVGSLLDETVSFSSKPDADGRVLTQVVTA
jgi:hypothetical protein